MEIGAKRSPLYIGSLRSYSEFELLCVSVPCPQYHMLILSLPSYPLSLAVNAAYSLALRLKVVPHHSGSIVDLEAGGYAPLPGGARAEAERRRSYSYSNCMTTENAYPHFAELWLSKRLTSAWLILLKIPALRRLRLITLLRITIPYPPMSFLILIHIHHHDKTVRRHRKRLYRLQHRNRPSLAVAPYLCIVPKEAAEGLTEKRI